MDVRYPSWEAFWPTYISEHRLPATRKVHFLGTGGYLLIAVGCAITSPLTFLPAVAATLALGAAAFRTEARRPAYGALIAMIALTALGHPGALLGILFAYACAWVGHFRIEHNRPATFTYPLWSLYSDFVMFGYMLQGRLWSGDGAEEVGPPRPPEDFYRT